MAWPENIKNVQCINFTSKFLPILRKAIEGNMVRWSNPKVFAAVGSAQFEWAGCKWELHEYSEIIQLIILLEGDLNTEDLTVAMLRG